MEFFSSSPPSRHQRACEYPHVHSPSRRHDCSSFRPRYPETLTLAAMIVALALSIMIIVITPLSPARAADSRYVSPTGGQVEVVEDFDPPEVRWGAGHRGVDLAWPAGSSVLAPAPGTVAFAGQVAGRPVISIDHDDGIRTTYEPVEPAVRAGDHVERGQVLGTLIAGHRTDGVDALHWGARRSQQTYINPLWLLQRPTIRLKPVLANDA